MIQFFSLNNIIDDLLLEARSNNIAESESLSRIQVEQWIIQYRSMLLKQDVDKGKEINPDYIQEIVNIPITDKYDNGSYIAVGNVWVGRTTLEIPNGIDFNFEYPILNIYDSYDNMIQMMSEKRAKMQFTRRYTSNNSVAYKKDKRIYVVGQGDVDKVTIRGVFENPLDSLLGLNADARYPIPANMVGPLKELIMTKEMNIVALSDTTNDGANDLTKSRLNENDYRKLSKGIK